MIALLALLGAATRADAETRPVPGGSIVVPLGEQPVAPGDPVRALRWADQVIALATSEGLYQDGRPALADGDPVVTSPLGARVRVRAGVRTHDGRPVTAAEVAAALDKLRASPLGFVLGPVRGVQAVGSDAVELALSAPAAPADLAAILSAPQAAVPRTGPFVLGGADAHEVRLDAFSGYHGGRPWLDRVILRAYDSRSNEVSAFELGSAQMLLHGSLRRRDGAGEPLVWPATEAAALLTFVGFAAAAPPEARQAVALAIDADAVRRFAAREPATTVARPAANPARARALLASSAWHGKTLTLLTDKSRFADDDVAQKVQAQLQRVGLTVRIESASASEFERRLAANSGFDLFVGQCAPQLAGTRVCGDGGAVALYRSGLRAHHALELRGLRIDAAGRLRFDDAFLWRKAGAARP
ncbi:MAG TPA: ABC transporter substrate-binding protein [Polyangia bacterium]|nr:ABC transporter substrate-binding protein [Polyangia bacterium]